MDTASILDSGKLIVLSGFRISLLHELKLELA